MDISWKIKVGAAVLVLSSIPAVLCHYPQGYGPVSGSFQQNYAMYPTAPDGGMSFQNPMNYGYHHSPETGMKSVPNEDSKATDLAMKSAMGPLNSVVSSVAVPPGPITSILGLMQPQSVLQLQRPAGHVGQIQEKKSNCTSGCSAARSLYGDNETSIEQEQQPESGVQCHCWTFGLYPMLPPKSPKYPPMVPQYSVQLPEYPPHQHLSQFARSNGFFYLPMVPNGARQQSYGPQYRPSYPVQYRPYISRPTYSYDNYHPNPHGDYYYNNRL